MIASIQPRGFLPLVRCLTILSLATATFGQADPKTEPHEAPLERTRPETTPATLLLPGGADAATLAKVIADVGESPLAAIYEAMGEDARLFAQHNLTLSNPFFEGRVPGSHGNRVAADYIEFYFRKADLEPAFASTTKAADGTDVVTPNTTYRQPFSRGNEITVVQSEVSFDLGGGGSVHLKEGRDYTVLGLSGSGKVTAPVALVGYSISEGNDGYSSFEKTTDLSGKIAVIFRFEPMNESGKSKWAEEGWSPHASLDMKVQAAADHHAAGIILVNPPGAADSRAKQLALTAETKPMGTNLTIPVVMATPELVERLVQAADPADGPRRTLADFRKRADEGGAKGGVIDLPNAKVSLTTRMSVEAVMTDNVGGILRGRGKLADSYVVIGAHYDHVGYGPVGTQPQNNGKLHPGADDNGSGTSGVLVLVEKLTRAYADLPPSAAARSILFLTFSAEESGLIGSHYYVNHPSIPLDKIDLMLNLDMIGRLRSAEADTKEHGLEVQGTESAKGLYDWVRPYFEAPAGMEIKHGPEVAGNSDHASFYQKQRPVLFFFTGLHRQYHTPQDTGFTINQLGAARVIDLVYRIALGAAQREGSWEFAPRRREAAADPHAGDPASPPKGVGRVRFGIAPASYSDDKPGVEVGDVYEGTSAADAGIKIGDRLMKWNGKDIASVEAWMPLLTSHKPGDEVEVTLLREGKEMTVKVKLKGRDQGGK